MSMSGGLHTMSYNSDTLNAASTLGNEAYYRQRLQEASSYNQRLCASRSDRLPFIDHATGVAQAPAPWLHRVPTERIPAASGSGFLVRYPAYRWKRKPPPSERSVPMQYPWPAIVKSVPPPPPPVHSLVASTPSSQPRSVPPPPPRQSPSPQTVPSTEVPITTVIEATVTTNYAAEVVAASTGSPVQPPAPPPSVIAEPVTVAVTRSSPVYSESSTPIVPPPVLPVSSASVSAPQMFIPHESVPMSMAPVNGIGHHEHVSHLMQNHPVMPLQSLHNGFAASLAHPGLVPNPFPMDSCSSMAWQVSSASVVPPMGLGLHDPSIPMNSGTTMAPQPPPPPQAPSQQAPVPMEVDTIRTFVTATMEYPTTSNMMTPDVATPAPMSQPLVQTVLPPVVPFSGVSPPAGVLPGPPADTVVVSPPMDTTSLSTVPTGSGSSESGQPPDATMFDGLQRKMKGRGRGGSRGVRGPNRGTNALGRGKPAWVTASENAVQPGHLSPSESMDTSMSCPGSSASRPDATISSMAPPPLPIPQTSNSSSIILGDDSVNGSSESNLGECGSSITGSVNDNGSALPRNIVLFTCEVCGTRYRSTAGLRYHYNTQHHGYVPNRPLSASATTVKETPGAQLPRVGLPPSRRGKKGSFHGGSSGTHVPVPNPTSTPLEPSQAAHSSLASSPPKVPCTSNMTSLPLTAGPPAQPVYSMAMTPAVSSAPSAFPISIASSVNNYNPMESNTAATYMNTYLPQTSQHNTVFSGGPGPILSSLQEGSPVVATSTGSTYVYTSTDTTVAVTSSSSPSTSSVAFPTVSNPTDFQMLPQPPLNTNTQSSSQASNKDNNSNSNSNELCDECGQSLWNAAVESGREGIQRCADCARQAHMSCLQFNDRMRTEVEKYKWQCIECKTCWICSAAENEEEMLFCDACDRGYHMYCLDPPLQEPPEGTWKCPLCRDAN